MICCLVMIVLRHTGVSWLRENTVQCQWRYHLHHHRNSQWGSQHRWHGSPLIMRNLQNSHVVFEGKCHAGADCQCHWRGTLHSECMAVVEHDNDLLSDIALKHMFLTRGLPYYHLCVLGEIKNQCYWPCTPSKSDHTLGHLSSHIPLSAECDPAVLQ